MIIAYNPAVSNDRSAQKQNFGKVNEKWLKKMTESTGSIFRGFHDVIAFRDISREDAVDTLNAVKPKYCLGLQRAIQEQIDWAKKYLNK